MRPRFRGVLHQWSAVAAALTGVVLVVGASSARAAWAAAVFAASLTVQLATSALYHRVTWSDAARARMRRADHAMIFVLIAGTATPFALLSMPPDLGRKLLALFWGGAALGVAVIALWHTRPKWVMAVLCIGLGWAGLPWWLDARSGLDGTTLALLATGGALYSVGALCYALKRPALAPATFGYHELFHALTIAAALCNVVAVARAVAG